MTTVRVRRKEERHTQILELMREDRRIRTSDLARRLGVSTETIRRDIAELTEDGAIVYRRRSVVLEHESPFSLRREQDAAAKVGMARHVVSQLAAGQTIMVGHGSTTHFLAQEIARLRIPLTVITYSIAIAEAIGANSGMRVMLAPGTYHHPELAVYGAQTVLFMKGYYADHVFVGASGLSREGPSEALVTMADTMQTMVDRGTITTLLADHTKFDRVFTATFAEWGAIDKLVTSRPPSAELASWMEEYRIDVEVAPTA
jgi:DeoR/GlpR family transcriptional regulator of sugar metabolism